jgi:membrane protease YdiL (CAAX protease family)
MFEQPKGGGWGMMVLEVLSLVVWAPVVEEIIFRGRCIGICAAG